MDITNQEHRNKKIIALLDTGQYTLAEVGERFGITRQMVHLIYQKYRERSYKPTRQLYKHLNPVMCSICKRRLVVSHKSDICKIDYQKQRYHANPVIRQRRLDASEKWRQENREKVNAHQRLYRRMHYQRKKHERESRTLRGVVKKLFSRVKTHSRTRA
jgi:hypothetical protein